MFPEFAPRWQCWTKWFQYNRLDNTRVSLFIFICMCLENTQIENKNDKVSNYWHFSHFHLFKAMLLNLG